MDAAFLSKHADCDTAIRRVMPGQSGNPM